MSINVGLLFTWPWCHNDPIWPHPPSKSPFGLLWEEATTSFMSFLIDWFDLWIFVISIGLRLLELNSVWYFYYSTYFLFFSLITFTTQLKLAPQDLFLFTFHFHDWALSSWFLGMGLNIADSEWLDCLFNSMSVHHHLVLEIDTLNANSELVHHSLITIFWS